MAIRGFDAGAGATVLDWTVHAYVLVSVQEQCCLDEVALQGQEALVALAYQIKERAVVECCLAEGKVFILALTHDPIESCRKVLFQEEPTYCLNELLFQL